MPRINPRVALALLKRPANSNTTVKTSLISTSSIANKNQNKNLLAASVPSSSSSSSIFGSSSISTSSHFQPQSFSRKHFTSSLLSSRTSSFKSSPSPILSLLSSSTSTSTSTSTSISSSFASSTSSFNNPLGSLRFRSYGAEYQPSQRIRKRRHGFLNRLKSRGGRKILKRRMEKGRRFLTH